MSHSMNHRGVEFLILARPGHIENAPDVDSSAAISIRGIVAIAHQPALFDKFAVGVHGGNGVTGRQGNNLLPPTHKERIAANEKRPGVPLAHGGERGIDLAWRAGVEKKELPAERASPRPPLRFAYARIPEVWDQPNSAIIAGLATISCSSPIPLPATRVLNQLTPVALPPGRFRLAT